MSISTANTKTPHIWIVPDGVEASERESSLPIRTATARAGRPMASALRFCRRKKVDRKSGWRSSTAPTGTVTAFARRVTSLATEADGELWSPDGKHILFASDVYPDCDDVPEAEANCNATKTEGSRAIEGQGA